MNAIVVMGISIVVLLGAYFLYGRFLTRFFDLQKSKDTPAHEQHDGVDFVPAKPPVLLGHHFASIAGAGPILGPIIASTFGWVPVFLWILVGGIFFGGVHDMATLVASVRHKGGSIGNIIENYLGRQGKILFMSFAYLTMILVIAVFCKIVATTFVNVPAVASSSFLFIILAVLFGFTIYKLRMPLLPATIIGVILLFLFIGVGSKSPISVYQNFLPKETRTIVADMVKSDQIKSTESPLAVKNALNETKDSQIISQIEKAEKNAFNFWVFIILVYVLIASVTPVWALLQPRDYLNSFLLYGLLFGGVIGVFFAKPGIVLSEITTFKTSLGTLFPVLFVTVACGAISGFHSLVSGGTTSKQLDKELDAKLIGYGGMLIESLLAVLALLAAAAMLKGRYDLLYQKGDFISIFSEGLAGFMSSIPLLNIKATAAITFTGLAVSAFALTTLDTCTRLARFTFQEFFANSKSKLLKNRYFGTIVTIVLSALFIFSGSSKAIWPIFGSANQLLAALALLTITMWLIHIKKNALITIIPMIFMYIVTFVALTFLIYQNWVKSNFLLVFVGFLLVIVAIAMAVEAFRKIRQLNN